MFDIVEFFICGLVLLLFILGYVVTSVYDYIHYRHNLNSYYIEKIIRLETRLFRLKPCTKRYKNIKLQIYKYSYLLEKLKELGVDYEK